jgi:SNF2 family DNA or RNA helicase
MWLKRLFPKIDVNAVPITIPADEENSRDLEWFCHRYPLQSPHMLSLYRRAEEHRKKQAIVDRIVYDGHVTRSFTLAVPPREYQEVGAAWALAVKRGLLADEVGVGKTCTAIATLSAGDMFPAVVVCDTHLKRQWDKEIQRFVPGAKTHILKQQSLYDITATKVRGRPAKHDMPDIVICSYSMLSWWARELADTYRLKGVVFDEVQALRRNETDRYGGAVYLADRMEYVLGMSATPIYNYGGEIFNVGRVIWGEGRLGTREEFYREWCTHAGDERKARLKSPEAFGAWMRSNHMMLRRTRKDVRRELPGLQVITHTVDTDPEHLNAVEEQAGQLARMILSDIESKKGDKMRASEEFSNTLRLATGLAKAPYVAAFVDLLVESGEKVVLFGWHHAVYSVWKERLKQHNPVMYTGLQSANQKDEALRAFREGESQVLIISLRAGAGIDGLQYVSKTAVVGELDWSPMVIHQCIGRVNRDGQADPVTGYVLVADDGLDPIMMEVLGIKKHQSEQMLTDGKVELQQRLDSGAVLRRLAEKYARKPPVKIGRFSYMP